MKILYVGNYASPDVPCYQICPNAEYIQYALEKLGHEVKGIHEYLVKPAHIIEELKKKKYDFILTEEARLNGDFIPLDDGDTKVRGLFRKVMTEASIPIVAWLTNIFFMIPGREKQIKSNPIFKADIVFTTDCGHQKEFEKAGVKHVCLHQGMHEPEIKLGTPIKDFILDIGFIGSHYQYFWSYRGKLLEWLKETYGNKFRCFGERGDIRHDRLNDLIASLKIVIGDSIISPYYWSNRLYEMLGRGAFMIFPYIEGIEKEYTPYKHFIPYNAGDFKTLKEIIDYYLKHEKERDKIRFAAMEHTRKYHTYEHRVKKMLKILEERKII